MAPIRDTGALDPSRYPLEFMTDTAETTGQLAQALQHIETDAIQQLKTRFPQFIREEEGWVSFTINDPETDEYETITFPQELIDTMPLLKLDPQGEHITLPPLVRISTQKPQEGEDREATNTVTILIPFITTSPPGQGDLTPIQQGTIKVQKLQVVTISVDSKQASRALQAVYRTFRQRFREQEKVRRQQKEILERVTFIQQQLHQLELEILSLKLAQLKRPLINARLTSDKQKEESIQAQIKRIKQLRQELTEGPHQEVIQEAPQFDLGEIVDSLTDKILSGKIQLHEITTPEQRHNILNQWVTPSGDLLKSLTLPNNP